MGFNIIPFDYKVLSGLSNFDFSSLPTLDILIKVHERLGYRLSLDHLAFETLGCKKSADGLMARPVMESEYRWTGENFKNLLISWVIFTIGDKHPGHGNLTVEYVK